MTTLQLTEFVHRTESAIARQCMQAKKDGLLSARKIPNGKKTGRSTVKFYRTDKAFKMPAALPALEKVRPVYADIQPFRDPLTAAFYGEYVRTI